MARSGRHREHEHIRQHRVKGRELTEDFTNDELHRIDVLYGTDFKEVTPGDAPLIARWERAKALQDAELQARLEALTAEAEEKKRIGAELAQSAHEALAQLRDAALARLERIDGEAD